MGKGNSGQSWEERSEEVRARHAKKGAADARQRELDRRAEIKKMSAKATQPPLVVDGKE